VQLFYELFLTLSFGPPRGSLLSIDFVLGIGMIHFNNKNNRFVRTASPIIFTLALMMVATTSSMVAPAAATTTATMLQPVTVTTDNQSVNLLISWEPVEIEPGQDIEFKLNFQNPSSGESIRHVNYNFEITDQNGETIQSVTDLHAHSGTDEQTVTFDNVGSFNLVATIIGTGINPPFDTTQSGTAQTVITVGQQLAGSTDGNNTAGRTDSITASTEAATATTSNTTTTITTPSSGLELSPQPIWDEQATNTGRTPINETHSIVSFIGNGTMTVPDTGETINMTNNGTMFVSPVPGYTDTVSAYGRARVFSEDDEDTTAITFYEIIRYDPKTFEGKGLVTAVFDRNATGMLGPVNGMMVVGTQEEGPNAQAATIRLWKWQSGYHYRPPPLLLLWKDLLK
jgi:hypothetical protein